MYHNPNSSKPIDLVQKVEEVECSGTIKEKQIEELQNLKGGQDTPTMVVEEQTQKVSQQEAKINTDDVGTHKELTEGVEQVVEHTQEQNQQGKITPLFEVSITTRKVWCSSLDYFTVEP